MRGIGKRRDAATRAARPDQRDLFGKKDLFDGDSFLRQGDQILTAGSDGLERESTTGEPGLEDPPIIGERYAGVEQVGPHPFLPPVGFEIAVNHLPQPGRVAHSLTRDLALPARVEEIRLLFYR